MILDDWGITPLRDQYRRDLLEVIDDRDGTRSTVLASQIPVNKWHDYVGDPTVADAPTVLAMGERKIALRIRELALDHGVALVEDEPLARALFATAQVGAPIPIDLFIAVAEILAYVYRQAAMRPIGRAPWRGAEA